MLELGRDVNKHTSKTMIDEVNRLLESSDGKKKMGQLEAHFERPYESRDIPSRQVARLGNRPGVAFYARVGTRTSARLQIAMVRTRDAELRPGDRIAAERTRSGAQPNSFTCRTHRIGEDGVATRNGI